MTGYLRLVRDLTEPVVAPDWPPGVAPALLTATTAPRVHALMRAAYAGGGGTVAADFDTWWATTRHDPEFDAGLCHLALADGEPVGFALCWSTGFLKDLVVQPGWQGRGIGRALLGTALRALAERGHSQAALKVLEDNAIARRLYAELGFRSD